MQKAETPDANPSILPGASLPKAKAAAVQTSPHPERAMGLSTTDVQSMIDTSIAAAAPSYFGAAQADAFWLSEWPTA